MDHETLFTASKWDILKHLERGPSSPLALSKVCRTSIANVSQQLRLLEMAGLVSSERVSNRDKGKPRVMYRLTGNLSYLIATTDSFVEKKPVSLSEINKIIMRIWFADAHDLRYAMEKTFWKIEEHFEKLACIAVDLRRKAPLTFCIRFKGKALDLKPFTITEPDGTSRQVVFTTTLPPKEAAYVLYDPQGMLINKRSGEHEQ